MSIREMNGTLPATVAQQRVITITDTTLNHTHEYTLKDLNSGVDELETYTNGAGETTATVAAGIVAMILASTKPLFQALSPSVNSNVVTINGTPGVPFQLTLSGTAAPADAAVATLPSVGSQDFLYAGNFGGNVVPGAADHVILSGTASPRWNLKSGTAGGKFSTSGDWTGTIGQPGAPLAWTWTDVDIYGLGRGWMDVGASAISPIVWSTAFIANNAPAFVLLGSALVSFTVKGGSAALAPYQGQTSTCGDAILEGGALVVGPGVTLTNWKQSAGVGRLLANASGDVTLNGGALEISAASAIGGVVTIKSGTAMITSNGTIDQVDVYADARVIVSDDADVTLLHLYGGTLVYNRASGAIGTLEEKGGSVETVAAA